MGLLPDTYNYVVRMRRECREHFPRHRFQRNPQVSAPSIHHGTRTYVFGKKSIEHVIQDQMDINLHYAFININVHVWIINDTMIYFVISQEVYPSNNSIPRDVIIQPSKSLFLSPILSATPEPQLDQSTYVLGNPCGNRHSIMSFRCWYPANTLMSLPTYYGWLYGYIRMVTCRTPICRPSVC